ncbi:hypothetical protein [Bacillus multifaciens]|uniref:hypothetical protein n=1 Tax=Bacillus multifaciens TaxID=3068506 RepID=UPI0027415CB9|nr:hypothetical protein [Bacillus sp. WLY-B-L8]MDP7980467.1 hypothetical protein [Bacillus sp. WLY-B-L8]
MKFDVVESVKNLLGIEEGSNIELVFDNIGSVAPYISGAITSHRINRLKKRLEEHRERLGVIENKIKGKDAAFTEFLKQKAFPIILEDIMNDAQDEKVEFLFNGFENIIEREFKNEDRIIAYCDLLRELRLDEIKRLVELTPDYRKYKFKLRMEGKAPVFPFEIPSTEVEKQEHYEQEAYNTYIENRLENLGLITTPLIKTNKELAEFIGKQLNQDQFHRHEYEKDTKITKFGENIIDFFELVSPAIKSNL